MKEINGSIQTYNNEERNAILERVDDIFSEAGIKKLNDDIFSCVDELIKNAVKANYKFLLIKDRIYDLLLKENRGISGDEMGLEFEKIIEDRGSYDSIAQEILSREDISSRVREILNEEGKYQKIINRAFREKRHLQDEEKECIEELSTFNSIREKLIKNNIKILLKIQYSDDFIYIEITNTAPTLTKDLKRIYDKRNEFRKYRETGREHEFFINNLDTSESGFGLGYAKIDSFFSDWGLDPESTATIISSVDTTVLLILPLAELRKKINDTA